MIALIREIRTPAEHALIQQMHEMRAQVFSDRLAWDVVVVEGAEVDQFDACHPLYVLSITGDGKTVLGSVRLLKTLGPNMLCDVFSDLLSHSTFKASPTIWESSRFCISPMAKALDGVVAPNHRLNMVTVELLLGIVDAAMSSGIDDIVSVFDARMLRVLRAAGCNPELIGSSKLKGRVKTYAGMFAINQTLHIQLLNRLINMDQQNGKEPRRARRPISNVAPRVYGGLQ